MIQTFSVFYYGTTVDDTNYLLPFDEGGGELNAELEFGAYSLTELTVEIKRAMDIAGGQEYTITLDRVTRIVTISAAGTFDLLLSTGTTIGTSVFSLIGFNQASDLTGGITYSGIDGAGSVFEPQTKFQSYIDKADSQQASQGTVHKSANGQVEAVTFGIEKFYKFNIQWANDLGEHVYDFMKANLTGVEDLRSFMQEITRKGRFEFMPDIDDRNTFDKVILERTASHRDGIGYELKERFDQSLHGYFETGNLTLRVVE